MTRIVNLSKEFCDLLFSSQMNMQLSHVMMAFETKQHSNLTRVNEVGSKTIRGDP